MAVKSPAAAEKKKNTEKMVNSNIVIAVEWLWSLSDSFA